MRRCHTILLSLLVVLMMALSGCGGGGGGDDGTNESTESPGTSVETRANVFSEQNDYASDSASDGYALFSALDEEIALIDQYLGTDWYLKDWTEDDVRQKLSDEQIDRLSDELAKIHNEKVLPAAEKVKISHKGIVDSEQKIQHYLSILNSMGIHQRVFVLDDFLIAGAILSVFMATGLAVADEATKMKVSNAIDDAVEDAKEKVERLTSNIDILQKIKRFSIKGAIAGVYATAEQLVFAGAASIAKGYKAFKIKFAIDAASVGKSIRDIVIGVKKCYANMGDTEEKSIHLNLFADTDDEAPSMFYVGTDDSQGVFHNVPEGNWTFVLFREGEVRSVSQCVNVDHDNVEVSISMTPVTEELDSIDHICTENDGYFVWYVDNISLKDIFVGRCEAFISETPLCSLSGGGLDCSIYAHKHLLSRGYANKEEAIAATCATMSTIKPCGETWFCGWLGWIGSERHVIDSLHGCQ